jgi:hypothetical protein
MGCFLLASCAVPPLLVVLMNLPDDFGRGAAAKRVAGATSAFELHCFAKVGGRSIDERRDHLKVEAHGLENRVTEIDPCGAQRSSASAHMGPNGPLEVASWEWRCPT